MLPSNITELRNHLEGIGFNEYEIVPFFMDVLHYMTQAHRSKMELNAEMESLGWGIGVIDETIYSRINALIDEPVDGPQSLRFPPRP